MDPTDPGPQHCILLLCWPKHGKDHGNQNLNLLLCADPLIRCLNPDPHQNVTRTDPQHCLHSKGHGKSKSEFPLCLMIEECGSISLTYGSGCGSGRLKNIWILRILVRNTVYYYYVDGNMIKSTENKNLKFS
jgi:hypothetical protein